MKCERCGNKIIYTGEGFKWDGELQAYRHTKKDDCIAALKAKLEERGAGEKEYFAIPQDFWDEQIRKGLVKLAKDNTKPMSMQIEAILNLLQTKLAAQPVSETKPERFAEAREYAAGGIVRQHELALDCKDLLAAYAEAKVLLGNYIYPEFINWLKKWA